MTTTEPLMTSVEHRYGVTVLAVGGEIDMVTAPRLEKAIDDVLADDPPALVIDLTEVTFLASVGLQLLARINLVGGPAGLPCDARALARGPATMGSSSSVSSRRRDSLAATDGRSDIARSAVLPR